MFLPFSEVAVVGDEIVGVIAMADGGMFSLFVAKRFRGNRIGSCRPQKLWEGLFDPADAIILVRDGEWQQDEDGYSDDLEHDVVHSYSEQIYERYIVVPQGLTSDAS